MSMGTESMSERKQQDDSSPTPLPGSLPAVNATGTTAAPLLLLEQVSKWYGPVLALNQVTLELSSGITGLVGANGAGKSTLIKLATGQTRPTLGTVSISGVDASSAQGRLLVGYCPDHDAFYEDLTGREFLLSMARLCGYTATASHRRTEQVLDRVGMTDRADRKLRGFSKGMRQRMKLAQALIHDPKLLVLDEPLSGIDPIGRQEMLELFRSLAAEGRCLLISSHELEALEKLTNHVVIMARGRIAAVGSVEKIRDLLDDYPVSIRVEVDHPRELGRRLLEIPDVLGCDIQQTTVTIRAKYPKRFFPQFNKLVVEELVEVKQLEPLDDSAHAVLGYILGGSGKT